MNTYPVRLLRLPAVKDQTGLSRQSIYRLIAKGDFPSPVKLGKRTSTWDSREVEAWIASRIAARNAKGAA